MNADGWILAIDLGNGGPKVGVIDRDDRLVLIERIAPDARPRDDDIAGIRRWCGLLRLDRPGERRHGQREHRRTGIFPKCNLAH